MDITYIKNPKKSISPICLNLQIAYLIAIKEQHPDAWVKLKKIIDEVEKRLKKRNQNENI